jgi:hypothetical protein
VLRLLLVLLASTATVLLAGCPGGDPPPDAGAACEAGYLGDPEAEPEIELRALRSDGSDVPLEDGGDLHIIFPPQGGRVAFVGVRAKNLDACAVRIIGALRDPATKQVRLDGRTVNLRREPDGWGTTGRGVATNIGDSAEIGDYSNIPLCPNQWASQDVFDVPFELEVRLEDKGKKTAVKTITVTPRCAEPGPKGEGCRCLCRAGYQLGETCNEDAGEGGGGA